MFLQTDCTSMPDNLAFSCARDAGAFFSAAPKTYDTARQEWLPGEHAPSDANAVLTVFGQAINQAMLEHVISALKETVVCHQVRCHSLHGHYGDSVFVITCSVADVAAAKAALHPLADRWRIELVLQTTQPTLSSPGLLVMDMDSTLIEMECIDEIAKLGGVGDEVSAVTLRAMRGELDFKASLLHRVSCLKGIDTSLLAALRDSIPLMPGAALLINTLKANNWRVVLASGGFTYFADYLCERLGLDLAVSNTLAVEDGRLTGDVIGEIVDASKKAEIVRTQAAAWQIPHSQTIAMGDGANDLTMMATAALGVACHAKPKVNQQADVAILRSGLHSVLYLLAP
ncbi:phosphoserine phosphatase SerB [Alteromonas sp. CYL-A6]|uniref:phosphoserine phosphatase SerB n=1 Tax=Alteromonas nitratireducens TaxID=3390813 RepID=UPI0034ACACDE